MLQIMQEPVHRMDMILKARYTNERQTTERREKEEELQRKREKSGFVV